MPHTYLKRSKNVYGPKLIYKGESSIKSGKQIIMNKKF